MENSESNNTILTMFQLLEYILFRIKKQGYFSTIIHIEASTMTLKIWSKSRYGLVSMTEELLNDMCNYTEKKRNEYIDMTVKSAINGV